MKPRRPRKHRKALPPLGDAVAAIAQPIARAIDRIAGTDIEHCKGCAKRQKTLNNLGKPTRTLTFTTDKRNPQA